MSLVSVWFQSLGLVMGETPAGLIIDIAAAATAVVLLLFSPSLLSWPPQPQPLSRNKQVTPPFLPLLSVSFGGWKSGRAYLTKSQSLSVS